MARLRRYCPVGRPQHVIQRGNNRSVCFADDSDMAAYAHFLLEAAVKHSLSIHGWVFMTNHVHLLVTPASDHALSKTMQTPGSPIRVLFQSGLPAHRHIVRRAVQIMHCPGELLSSYLPSLHRAKSGESGNGTRSSRLCLVEL